MKLTLIPLLFSVLLSWQVQATEKYKIEAPHELKTSRLEVKTPIAGVDWITDQERFDYVKTCETVEFVVVIAHDANQKDLLVENGNGNIVHDRDMRIGYPRLADFCAVIVEPKSMLSTTHNDDGVEFNWRTWWATDFVKDYIVDEREHFDLLAFINAVKAEVKAEYEDNEYEIEDTIKFIKFARSELHKPVYLGIGNDFGGLAVNVLDKLVRDSETDVVDGFLHVNRETGEFTTYHRDGTILESKDN